MRRWVFLGAAAVAFLAAAFSTDPGFFDGFAPPQPYRWVSPPPGVPNGGSPAGIAQRIAVVEGQSAIASIFTPDNQASVTFEQGAFQVTPGMQSVAVRIEPQTRYPAPKRLNLVTNVYLITATAPLRRPALVTLRYSDIVTVPSGLFEAPASGGGWRSLPGTQVVGSAYYVTASTSQFGYFAAGTVAAGGSKAGTAPAKRQSGINPFLIVGGIVLLLLLGAAPLLLLRREPGGPPHGGGPPASGTHRG